MSEQINLQGVVSKPWVGSSALLRWLGYALIAAGFLSSIGGLLPIIDASFIIWPTLNSGLVVVFGSLLVALANVTALMNEIFHANHTIID